MCSLYRRVNVEVQQTMPFSSPSLFWIALGIGAVGLLAFLVSLLLILGTKKVGPHQALLVYGPKGTKVVSGGSTFVNPITSHVRPFPLGIRSCAIQPLHPFYTREGIGIAIDVMTQLRVRTDDQQAILLAAEAFLGRSNEEQEAVLCSMLEGHLRNSVGQIRLEDLINNTAAIGSALMSACTPDLEKLGMEIISFTLRSVATENGALGYLGRSHLLEMRKQAVFAEAIVERDMHIQRANLSREKAVVSAQADHERVKAEIESLQAQAIIEKRKEDATRQHALAEASTEAEALRLRGQAEADVIWLKQIAARGERAIIGECTALAMIAQTERSEGMIIVKDENTSQLPSTGRS